MKSRYRKWQRVLAAVLCAVLVIFGEIPFGHMRADAAAGGSRRYVDGDDGSLAWAVEFEFAGAIRSFTAGGEDRTVTAGEPFEFNLEIPAGMSIPDYTHAELYIVPYTAGNTPEGFLAGPRHIVSMGYQSTRYTPTEKELVSIRSADATTYDMTDIMEPKPLASGPYYLACLISCGQIVNDRCSGYLVTSAYPFRVDNPSDGGYRGDDYYGVFIDDDTVEDAPGLDVEVYLDYPLNAVCENVNVMVYSENGMICYGRAPLAVPVGEIVCLSITPFGADEELQNHYDFPNIRAGNAYVVQVPEDGKVTVTVAALGETALIGGYVYDESGAPIAGASVSATMSLGDSRTVRDMARNCVTDQDGYYEISGLLAAGDITIRASADGYRSSKVTVAASDIASSQYRQEFWLKEETAAFTVRFTGAAGDVADAMIEEIYRKRLIEGDYGSGSFRLRSNRTVQFFPDSDEDCRSTYRLQTGEPYMESGEYTVAFGGEVQVTLADTENVSLIRYTPTGLQDYNGTYIKQYLLFFDQDGVRIGYDVGSGSESRRLLLPASSGTLVSFSAEENHIYSASYSLSDLLAQIDREPYQRAYTAERARVTELGDIPMPYVENTNTDKLFEGRSYVNAPDKVSGIDELLTVSGHVECSQQKAYKVTGLWIYAQTQATKSSLSYVGLSAGYENGTLAINGKLVSAALSDSGNFTKTGKLIEFREPLTEAFNFSCKLRTFEEGDMTLVVAANVEIDGVESMQTIGEYSIRGKKVTLEANSRTATGLITCRGSALAGGGVTIFDGDREIGGTRADAYGRWEAQVSLSGGKTESAVHALRAVCTGYSSGTVYVTYDRDGVVVRGIYVADKDGSRYSASYIWKLDSEFIMEADVENADMIGEQASFLVVCSDGNTVSLPARAAKRTTGATGVTVVTYQSEAYPFGARNLVPVKIYFEWDTEEDEGISESEWEAIIEARGAGTKRVNINAVRTVTPESLKAAYPSSINVEVSTGAVSKQKVSADGNISYLTYETDAAFLIEMERAGAEHVCVCGAGGDVVYDVYSQYTDYGMMYGIYDHTTGKRTVYETLFYTADNIPEKLISNLSASADGGAIMAMDRSSEDEKNGEQATVHMLGSAAQEMGSYAVDWLKKVLEKAPNYSKYAKAFKSFGAGKLMDGAQFAQAAMYVRSIDLEQQENEQFFDFLTAVCNAADSNGNMRKASNAVRNARASYELARSEAIKYLETYTMDALSNMGLSKMGVFGEIIGMTYKSAGISAACLDAQKAYVDVMASGAKEDRTDALRNVLKSTGMSMDELTEMFNEYQKTGKVSPSKFREKMKGGSAAPGVGGSEDPGSPEPEGEINWAKGSNYCESVHVQPIVDPSGYVYEAVASNRIEGAVVTLYEEGMTVWNAEAFDQINPLYTDADGRYAWDVPLGNWFVKVYKEGYEPGDSQNDPAAVVTIGGINYLPVLPPQLDVNIGLTSMEKPKATLSYADGKWILRFSRYVEADSVTADSVTVTFADDAGSGYRYALTALNAEVSPQHTPICGGKLLASEYELAILDASGAAVTGAGDLIKSLTLSGTVIGYNGVSAQGSATIDKGTGQSGSGGGAGDVPGVGEDTQPGGEKSAKKGSKAWVIVVIIIVVLLVCGGGGVAAYLLIRKKKGQQGQPQVPQQVQQQVQMQNQQQDGQQGQQ